LAYEHFLGHLPFLPLVITTLFVLVYLVKPTLAGFLVGACLFSSDNRKYADTRNDADSGGSSEAHRLGISSSATTWLPLFRDDLESSLAMGSGGKIFLEKKNSEE
jgi:hypothetical protein